MMQNAISIVKFATGDTQLIITEDSAGSHAKMHPQIKKNSITYLFKARTKNLLEF